MFLNQDALIGIYSSSASTVSKVQLFNFSVTTTSGTILIDWGDGLSDTITSSNVINHNFTCVPASAPAGLWNSIQPCI
jgi:hypothetical protein